MGRARKNYTVFFIIVLRWQNKYWKALADITFVGLQSLKEHDRRKMYWRMVSKWYETLNKGILLMHSRH